MTDLELVRLYASDSIQYDTTVDYISADQLQMRTKNAPIVALSEAVYLVGTLKTRVTDYSIDNDLGLIIFTNGVGTHLKVEVRYRHSLLSDTQLQGLLDQYTDSSDNVKLAAADALDIIANSAILILKKIKMLDVETDAPAMARELRAGAKSLRDQVFDPAMEEPAFDIAEQVYDTFTYYEKINKDLLREG